MHRQITQTGFRWLKIWYIYLWKPMSMSTGVTLSLELCPKNSWDCSVSLLGRWAPRPWEESCP